MSNSNQPGNPVFKTRDATSAEFWSERFAQNHLPWDKGTVPVELQNFVSRSPHRLVTLIPGCGLGHEVACLAEANWEVTAIDFSDTAVAQAKDRLGRLSSHVVQADFFSYTPEKPVELIYERAFLCALPPRMWDQVAVRWAQLLPPGGLLAGFFYIVDAVDGINGRKGPPFAIRQAQLDILLMHDFEGIVDQEVTDSVKVFRGSERWQIWRRRSIA